MIVHIGQHTEFCHSRSHPKREPRAACRGAPPETVNGIVNGMILAPVTSGLTLILGIMDVVGGAHGDLVMVGGFPGATTLAVSDTSGWRCSSALGFYLLSDAPTRLECSGGDLGKALLWGHRSVAWGGLGGADFWGVVLSHDEISQPMLPE